VKVGRHPRQRSLRKLALRCVFAVGCAASLGATSRIVFDVLQWRTSVTLARDLCGNQQATEQNVGDAVTTLLRDATESIEALRRARDRGGVSRSRAEAALRALESETRR
jgi:hypothetical protein